MLFTTRNEDKVGRNVRPRGEMLWAIWNKATIKKV